MSVSHRIASSANSSSPLAPVAFELSDSDESDPSESPGVHVPFDEVPFDPFCPCDLSQACPFARIRIKGMSQSRLGHQNLEMQAYSEETTVEKELAPSYLQFGSPWASPSYLREWLSRASTSWEGVKRFSWKILEILGDQRDL